MSIKLPKVVVFASVLFVALFTLSILSACGGKDSLEVGKRGGDPAAGNSFAPSLTIWNRSQFDLLSVKQHFLIDHYQNSSNLIEGGGAVLSPEQDLFINPSLSNAFITVVHEKVRHGEEVAFTTAIPVFIYGGGYTLVVFDDAFRLLPPDHQDNVFASRAASTP